jgi:hypothetical protein
MSKGIATTRLSIAVICMRTCEDNRGRIPSPLASGFATARDKVSETNLPGVVATIIVCCTCGEKFVRGDDVTIALHDLRG